MSRVLALTAALVRDWWRNREAVFFAVLFPIIILVLFSAVFASSAPQFTIHVQNNDVGTDGEPTAISASLVEALDQPDPLTVRTIPAGRDLEAWARENETGPRRVVVIPEGFADQVQRKSAQVRQAVILDTVQRFGDRLNDSQRRAIDQGAGRLSEANVSAAQITFRSPPDDNTAPAIRGILTGVVASFNNRAIGAEDGTATLSGDTIGEESLTAVDYFLPAIIGMVLLINGVMTVTTNVANLRDDGTLKRLVATPMRKRDWIAANLLQQTLLAFGVTAVMLVVASLGFGVTAIPGPLAIVLLVLGAVGFSALGLTLGSVIRDPDAATTLANAIAFPLMFISGLFWQIEILPDFLQMLARLSPLYHFHRGLRQLMIVGTTEGTLLAFGSVGLLAVVFTGLAIRLTDWEHFDA